jgi:hypothetical protein
MSSTKNLIDIPKTSAAKRDLPNSSSIEMFLLKSYKIVYIYLQNLTKKNITLIVRDQASVRNADGSTMMSFLLEIMYRGTPVFTITSMTGE